MYLLLASMYWWTAWDISSLVLFSTVNNLSISVNRPNSTFVFLKAASHASPVGEKNDVGQVYLFYYIFRKFSNTSESKSLPLWSYQPW